MRPGTVGARVVTQVQCRQVHPRSTVYANNPPNLAQAAEYPRAVGKVCPEIMSSPRRIGADDEHPRFPPENKAREARDVVS